MRTLAVMHLAEISGPARTLRPRLATLAERGELETLIPERGPVADLYEPIGKVSECAYRALTFPGSPRAAFAAIGGILRDVSAIRAQIRRVRPDVVIVVTSTLPAALIAARLERVPAITYVAEIFDRPFARSMSRSLARKAVLRLTARFSSVVVCCSKTVARQFRTSRRVVAIYPGIAASAGGDDSSDPRELFGIPGKAPVLAVVGSISAGRGQDVAIRSLPHILSAYPEARCLMVGLPHQRAVDLAFQQDLVKLAHELGVSERVVFTGYVLDIESVYRLADVVVNPARCNEAFGRVAMEALAAGTPVVVTRVGAIPELLADRREALLVAPDDPEELARAVIAVWSDSALADRMVSAGRELVRSRFNERRGVEEFVRVVEATLAGHGHGSASVEASGP